MNIEFILKAIELRAKNFDANSAVDSSFILDLEKTGFVDSVWKK